MPLQPGTYRITELASMAAVTRTTVDKWEVRYSLQKILVEHDNREVGAYVLSEEQVNRLTKEYPTLAKDVDNPSSIYTQPTNQALNILNEYQAEQIDELKALIVKLQNELEISRDNLSQVQIKCSRLEGLLENHNLRLADKDAVIAAKDGIVAN